ncbi:4-hydroxythreonine-4-phosphate dehydrogenase PdxA [Acidisphaera sp. L21]|uniref:4-hydroxythreonine-4-phosphate dehydrogenase PdxA n=1 Tax=Acidisphaera sp. L21 TaxID=1641851 RepID=UPI00131E6C5C|nr:4-hydroxythreonine-4-phosphate dehydrogenase PdxA [Acidisphaera sp. L21]
MSGKPLVLTMGDPAGIGGEITAKAWRALAGAGPGFAIIADPFWIGALDVPMAVIKSLDQVADVFASALPVLALSLPEIPHAGRPDPANAPAVIASIERAVRLVQAGEAGAMVTNPISKAVLYQAGFPHPGHTEFLGELTGGTPVMMLACPHLRVVPVTIHVSLRRALEGVTTEAILATARATHAALRRDFGIAAPRLAVAGLNPHAGEQGAMGVEEIETIIPAIAALQAEGIDATGPYPPDTMFTDAARPTYDAAICMYHDQALIPLKTLDMAGGVNVTLGLPIIRTSPDHGTAFGIAGQGVADPGSLIAAIRMAAELAHRRTAA